MDALLVINAGSSSLKFRLYRVGAGDALPCEFAGQLDGIGVRPRLHVRTGAGATMIDRRFAPADLRDLPSAIAATRDWLRTLDGFRIVAIGHRVVHGGPDFAAPVRVDADVLERLSRYEALAPLHQPANLAAIRLAMEIDPGVPQVACFDTAFHRGHPEVVDTYALPRRFYDAGIRRYCFHGLSYEYVAMRLRQDLPGLARGRVVVAHLGSGASMCALSAGRSVETTMGFSALDGLPMATRSGQIDPGVVLHLVTAMGMNASDVEHLLYHDAGLAGLSGIGGDMRTLLESDAPRARLAIDHFVYRAALATGQLAAALGGIDGMVFTAGIGENAPEIRARIAARLGWLGAEVDPDANARGGPMISTPASRVALHVIPTDEELMIARHTLAVVGAAPHLEGAPA